MEVSGTPARLYGLWDASIDVGANAELISIRAGLPHGIGYLFHKPEHPQVACAAPILLVQPIVFALPLIRSMLRSTSSSLPAEF